MHLYFAKCKICLQSVSFNTVDTKLGILDFLMEFHKAGNNNKKKKELLTLNLNWPLNESTSNYSAFQYFPADV